MKRKFTLLIAALALLTMIVQPGRAWGQTPETFTFSELGYSNGAEVTTVNGTNVTLTFAQGTNSSNAPKYYDTGTAVRMYTGNTLEIALNDQQGESRITAIAFTFSGTYTGSLQNWTGSETSVSFTNTASGQARIQVITVTYTEGGTPVETVATPTFDPAAGSYTEAQSVNISCETDGATIYYTTDGNAPTTSSDVYSTALSITETTTVKAMAVKEGMNNSAVATAAYTINTPYTGDPYVRITELSNLTDGATVIIAARYNSTESSYYAMTAATTGKPTGVSFTSTTSSNGECLPSSILNEEDTYSWTVGINSNGYTFTNANNQVLGYNSGTNFATGGNNTEWTITRTTAGNSAMVGGYQGFYIVNKNNTGRGIALNNQHNYGPYATSNNNSSDYNFYLDIFVQGYAPASVATPTFSPVAGSYIGTQNVTISCETGGSTIYYTTDGSVPSNQSTQYNGAITVSETTTIKAIAYVGSDASAVATATYSIVTPFTTMQAIFDDATTTPAEHQVYITFDNWVITGANTSQHAFLSDNTKGCIIYGTDHGFTAGDVLSGTAQCKIQLYHESVEITELTNTTTGLTVTPDGNVSVANIPMANLTGVNTGALVSYENLICEERTEGNYTNYYLSDGDTEIQVYRTLFNDYANYLEDGKTYNITGVFVLNNTTKRVNPRSADDIVEVTIPVLTTENVDIACDATEGVITYTVTNPASDGNLTAAITDGNEDGWLTLGTIGANVPFTCTANTGAERTATVTLTYTYNTTETVTATAVVTQAAYVVPTASIVVTPTEVNATADETEGTITVTLTAIEDDNIEIVWFESDGETQATEPAWITAVVNVNNNIDYLIEENTGDARTAYFKVYGLDGDANDVYSELITINQAAPVADYATLPFEWVGSSTNGSSSLTSMNGVTASGLGSDYAASNAPYRIKLDGTGDYIQIKTNEQPGLVTLEVKMLGGAETSYITVQGSTDGETFDQGEALEISGAQNTELTLTSTRTFDEDVRYVRMVFTKGSNVGVGSITIEKYVVKYTVNLNQPLNNEGTIAADKEEAAEGETVTLTATPNTGYAFDSWTVLDEDAQEVTVINNAFEMPASDVEVEATFTALPKHNIIIPAEIENNVIVDATGNQAYATETVTITVDAPANKVLATLTVTGNTSSGIITITPEVSPYVEEYTFTMPEEDVTINATFTDAPTFTVSFSVNGTIDEDLELSVTQGQGTQLPTISTLTPEGFSITGWSESNNSTEAVADPYTPTENITLYAILGQTMPHSLAINASTPNFPKSYGPANTFTEYNLAGKNFMIQQGYKNGSILQWRASGNSNGTGTMYNREDLGKINTIILVYDQTDGNKNFTIKAGTTENPTGGTEIAPTINNLIYTFDLSQGDYNYFVMTNGTGAGYLQSISIDYELDLNINTVTTITSPTASMSTDIPATTCVIVKDGAVLTFTGQNDGTADNLIIEDGGQVIVSNSGVQATFKKSVSHSAAKDANNWYTISSPVNNITPSAVTNLIQTPADNYDLYYYDEENVMWKNHKKAAITNLTNGKGYLYWNAGGDELSFPGELNSGNIEIALTKTGTGDLAGWNLIGNPYSHNIYKGAGTAIVNSVSEGYELTTGFYTLANSGAWVPGTDNTTAIVPGQGILVKATTAGTLTMTNTNSSGTAKANNDNIQFLVSNSEYEDITYALFNTGIGLDKINHRNAEIPMVYIPQNGQDYAIATMSDDTEMFNLNFKAMTTGQYTLSVDTKGNYSYLHIYDKMTNEDVDMLLEGEYSFIGSPRDAEDRFVVRLSYRATIDGNDTNIFAYQSGSDIIVSGNGELQVFDVMGRMVATMHVNGVQTMSTSSLQTGLYIFRLNEKTQKIVVR